MKIISKKVLSTGLLVALFVISVITGPYTHAIEGTLIKVEPDKVPSETVCARVAALALADTTEVKKRITAMQADFAGRLKNITSREDAADKKIATSRSDAMSKFDTKITAMKQVSGLTNKQLDAINTYQKEVKAANDARVIAVDGARTIYRTGLSLAISNHQIKLGDAVTTYQSSITGAFAAAKINCSIDTNALENLKKAVKTARETASTSISKIEATAQVRQLADTKKSSIKDANGAFAKKVAALTTTLKKILNS
jgi:hypothetical protein